MNRKGPAHSQDPSTLSSRQSGATQATGTGGSSSSGAERAAFHQDELLENWALAEKKQELFAIEPLR